MFQVSHRYVRVYRAHTVSLRKYRYYTSWYPHGSHVQRRVVGVIKRGHSLAPVFAASVSLFLRIYLRRGSAVSLQRGLLFLPSSLPLSLSCSLRRLHRFRLLSPSGAQGFSLFSVSSVFLLRSLSGVSRTSSVALISFANISSSHLSLGERGTVRPVSLFSMRLTPADPARPIRPPTAIPSRAYTIGIFLVAPSILSLLSPSSRLVQER